MFIIERNIFILLSVFYYFLETLHIRAKSRLTESPFYGNMIVGEKEANHAIS
ncbi:hypothetical protein BREVNS_1220 [Brevinematales bacterium NS]|nr:hypothetical protein BREVNS_1220 [Brevinematales bacterium NS]